MTVSDSSAWPMRRPERAAEGSTYGALDMDSKPPATTTLASPTLMAAAASVIALSPLLQTLLIVVQGTLLGTPALSAACRAGFCPAPAASTLPRMT